MKWIEKNWLWLLLGGGVAYLGYQAHKKREAKAAAVKKAASKARAQQEAESGVETGAGHLPPQQGFGRYSYYG